MTGPSPEVASAPGPAPRAAGASVQRPALRDAPAASPDELRAAAAELADEIVRRALPTPDGGLTWRALRAMPGTPGRQERQVGPHLYDGTAGVALALAALARELGEPAWEEAARRAMAPLRRRLARLVRRPDEARALHLGLGAAVGLPSLLYALLRSGTLLGDGELVAEAVALAPLCSPERIAADTALDVVGGCAGAVLVLAALCRSHPSARPEALAAMRRCADRLAATAVPAGDGLAWPTLPGHPPLTGLAHGAAGIALALAAAHAATGAAGPARLARRALAFENGQFRPERRNWSDLRRSRTGSMNSWCHGAPGIAASRLALRGLMAPQELRADLDAGLATTADPTVVRPDHLCCGNLGRAEVLLLAHRELGRPDLLSAARALATAVLARRERRGHYSWSTDERDGAFDPSLFTGAAGVALVLARLAGPAADLPSPLLFE